MPVTPTGPLSIPLSALQTMAAASATFQAWTGTANPTAAAARVHLVGLPPAAAKFTPSELSALRPFALVDIWSPPQGWGGEPWKADRTAEVSFVLDGKLTLDLVADVDPADAQDYATAKLKFMNQAGGVLTDLMDQSGGGGVLSIRRLELFQGPFRSDPEKRATQGDFWRAQAVVHWGI